MKSIVTLADAHILILCFASLCAAASPDPARLDALMSKNSPDTIILQQISSKPVIYEARGGWTFAHSAKKTAAVTLDFPRYTNIFKHVFRCEKIVAPGCPVKAGGTWFLEGRYAFVRVLAIGDIDTVLWTDPSHLRLVAAQNNNPRLNKQWCAPKSGWLNYPCGRIQLIARIEALGPDSCRVGVLAQGATGQAFPQWLLKIAANVILSSLITDLQKELNSSH